MPGQDCVPGSPDNLPILGETSLPGYYAATGHYRDGIMLAPITAHLMAALITGGESGFDLETVFALALWVRARLDWSRVSVDSA